MDKVMKGIINACLVFCLIIMVSTTTVFAAIAVYGSEKAGYMVSSAQLRKKTNTFDDSALNKKYKKYKSYMTYGAKVWKDCGVVTLKRDKSSVNKVAAYQKEDTTILAYAQTTSDSQTGKIKKFTIQFNTTNMEHKTASTNNSVAAHEIGHTFGLLDLYEKRNEDKMMYGIANKDNAKPTAKDIKGAKYATRK